MSAIQQLVDNNHVIWTLLAGAAASWIVGAGYYFMVPHTFTNGAAIGLAIGGSFGMAMMALTLHLLGPTLEERVLNGA